MLFYTKLGLIGFVASIGVVVLIVNITAPVLHLGEGKNFVFALQGMALLMALFALTFDRCEEPTLMQGYKLNVSNFFMGMENKADNGKGILFRPDRQLCFFGIPLVLAPFVILIGIIAFWIYDLLGYFGVSGVRGEYPLMTLTSVASIALAFGYARLTRHLRNLPELVIVLRDETQL